MSARAWLHFQRLRARALLGRRGYRIRRGRTRVPIASLASPLRYDIVVRRDFLAELQRRLDEPHARLSAWARETPYWVWFRRVRWERASARYRSRHAGVEAAFADRVARAVALCRSFATRGFDPRWPIELKSADRMLPTEEGKRAELPLVAGSGCHRIALLWLAGQRELEPDQYVVRHYTQLAPLDNTRLLRELFVDRPSEYVRYVASAYLPAGAAVSGAGELAEWVATHAPERAGNLAALLRADGIVDAPSRLSR